VPEPVADARMALQRAQRASGVALRRAASISGRSALRSRSHSAGVRPSSTGCGSQNQEATVYGSTFASLKWPIAGGRRIGAAQLQIELKRRKQRSSTLRSERQQPSALREIKDRLLALQSEQLLDVVAAQQPPESFSPDQVGSGHVKTVRILSTLLTVRCGRPT
jgi:hypothetical protein